jgi:hypothetical protein
VLARLLALNAQRAEEERISGLAAAEGKKPARPRKTGKITKPGSGNQPEFF